MQHFLTRSTMAVDETGTGSDTVPVTGLPPVSAPPEAAPLDPKDGGDQPQGFAGTGGPSVGFTPLVVRTGAEVLVNTAVENEQFEPQITALSNGGFVVVWADFSLGAGGATGDTSAYAVKAQLLTSAGTLVGTEILVNTAVESFQYAPQITALSNGGFVVTWQDSSGGVGGASGDNSSNAVKAQVFTAAGAMVGTEILVNTAVASAQDFAQITALVDGGFVVTWNDQSSGTGGATGDTSGSAVKAQVFTAAGAMVGTEILVNTAVESIQYNPQITALGGGGFVVTWNDYSSGVGGATGDASSSAVKAQVFTAAGAMVGAEILVNTAVDSDQSGPQITALVGGGFVVTWNDRSLGVGGATGDASSSAVKAQVFTAAGAMVGTEILVNTAVENHQGDAQITALSNGGFVVAWLDYSQGVLGATGDASAYAVKAQVFTAAGAMVGTEILVNTAVDGDQSSPQITALVGGGFVVTWADTSLGVGGATGDASSSAVKAQVFTAAGAMVGTEILVNTAVENGQYTPQITALSNGGFAVTWHDSSGGVGGAAGDTSSYAVKAQVFNVGPTVVEQVALDLKAAGFTVSDPDAGDVLAVTLSTTYGLLTVTAGTSGAVVTNSGTASVTIAGTAAQIAALLNSDGTSTVSFMADTDAPPASATVTLAADDGAGGTASTNMILPIEDKAEFAGTGGPSVGFTPVVVRTGGEILVNTATHGYQIGQQITALSNGGFVVTWDDSSATAADELGYAVRAQVFTAAGAMVGTEILVNTATVSDQYGSRITALSSGGFVVTWQDYSATASDTEGAAVRAQVFTAAGVMVGAELLVNTTTAGDQNAPQISALSNGGFVVTWQDGSSSAGDTSSGAIRAQVFTDAGAMVGTEILVNTTTNSAQGSPKITALSNGGFVVTWEDFSGTAPDTSGYAVRAQVFTAAGAVVGTEILVNTTTISYQISPLVTALSNGGFVVTWRDLSESVGDTSGSAVRAQVFTAAGAMVGAEIFVNTATAGDQTSHQITALSNGGFVVTWEDYSATAPDTSFAAVRAQVFTAAGAMVGTEILVNTSTEDHQYVPQITALSNGGFVVTWADRSGTAPDSGEAVRAQVFTAAGAMVGTEILVNTTTDSFQNAPQVTALPNGGFVVTWQDYSATAPDTDGVAVRAQVFNVGPTAVEQVALSLKNTGFTVTDPDAGDVLTVTLSTTYGLLSATAGTSGAVVAGSGTTTVTLTGTAAQIAALLNSDGTSTVSFNADTDTPPASATITLAADDGQGGTASTSLILPIQDTAEGSTTPSPGDDTLTGTGGNDTISAQGGADTVNAGDGDDTVDGGDGDDVIDGGSGNDYLRGGLGADAMTGGTGNDTYVVDNAGDTTDETGGDGTDLVISRISWTLGAAIENLTLGNGGNLNGAGNALANVITGNSVANTLDGLAGADTLNGGGGDDVLNGGDDNDTLDGGTQDDSLNGGAGDDLIIGGAGHDRLSGGLGVDTMRGGVGNDTYVVDDAGDVVDETGGDGVDLVISRVGWTLGDGVENLTLGNGGTIGGTGNALGNIITGNSSANTLNGMAGGDALNGGGGDDILNGGDDNDILDGGTQNDTLSGGAGTDILLGGAGHDTLDGGADADRMTGGAGNDLYIVDVFGDGVTEALGEGTDTVQASISHRLAANVEHLTLTGSANVNGTGNALANALTGNSGANTLSGGDGADILNGLAGNDSLLGEAGNDTLNGGADNDSLAGGAGQDRLTGGTGADSFVFTTADIRRSGPGFGLTPDKDQILDLSFAANDRIDLSAIDANAMLAGDQAFVFVAKFTNTAGQATIKANAGKTLLQLDVDGDGVADLTIEITGNHAATTANLYTGGGDVNGGWVL